MSSLREATHFDRSQVDALTGVRAGLFAVTPLLVGLAAGHLGEGAIASLGALNEDVVSTLGAINIPLTEPGTASMLKRVTPPAFGCLLDAFAFSLGTIVGVAGNLAVPLVAVGVLFALIVRLKRELFQLGVVVAVVFVVGVGLPGGSVADAYSRFWLILAGGLWAFLGALLQWLAQHGRSPAAPPVPNPTSSEIAVHSVVVALTVAGGLAISDFAGLARDYWVMLTIISCVRLRPTLTLSFTTMRVLGTIGGAVVGLATTLALGASPVTVVPLVVFGIGMFATRNANYVVFTLFLTSFIILLLNLAYPGNQLLALTRVLDTCIGGALALVAGGVLWSVSPKPDRAKAAPKTR